MCEIKGLPDIKDEDVPPMPKVKPPKTEARSYNPKGNVKEGLNPEIFMLSFYEDFKNGLTSIVASEHYEGLAAESEVFRYMIESLKDLGLEDVADTAINALAEKGFVLPGTCPECVGSGKVDTCTGLCEGSNNICTGCLEKYVGDCSECGGTGKKL